MAQTTVSKHKVFLAMELLKINQSKRILKLWVSHSLKLLTKSHSLIIHLLRYPFSMLIYDRVLVKMCLIGLKSLQVIERYQCKWHFFHPLSQNVMFNPSENFGKILFIFPLDWICIFYNFRKKSASLNIYPSLSPNLIIFV